jgi:hypothetical protein
MYDIECKDCGYRISIYGNIPCMEGLKYKKLQCHECIQIKKNDGDYHFRSLNEERIEIKPNIWKTRPFSNEPFLNKKGSFEKGSFEKGSFGDLNITYNIYFGETYYGIIRKPISQIITSEKFDRHENPDIGLVTETYYDHYKYKINNIFLKDKPIIINCAIRK